MEFGEAQKFDGYYSSLSNKYLLRWVDHQKRSLLLQHFGGRTGSKVLDLGCGTGAVSKVLLPQQHVFGVDYDAAILKHAEAAGLQTEIGSFDNIPFENGFFDAVVMIDTIEHVPSREKAFREVRRILRADGSLLLITPAYDNPLWNIGERIGLLISRRKESGHISPFTREALRYFLGKDYSEVKIGTLNFSMWLYGVGRRLKSN